MTVVVSLLRGVNVGGHHLIKMERLKALYDSLELKEAKTLLQSGNVVFRTKERNLVQLATRIEDAIEESFQFRPAVIIRTAAEMRSAIAQNPFAGRTAIDPSKLLVTFLSDHPSAEIRERLLAIETAPEEVRLVGREMYIYFPGGMGRSKLPLASIGRMLKTPGTGRNWNTVTKLLEIAEKLEAAP
jgi:uncharacterized protein (DUF1697 family)